MAYADYTYYTSTYKGTAIAQADFPRLALRASEVVDQVTFDRASAATDSTVVDKVKMACCAVAEEIAALEASGGVVSSERVGNYSVTYVTAKSNGARYADAARRYLWNTELMYRGLNEDEC